MLDNLKGKKVILASGSPRRRQLLGGLEIDFTVRLIDGIDETYPDGMAMAEIPKYISHRKAEAYVPTMASDEIIITADTIVWADGEVLGKPHTPDEAVSMLRRLSGRTHQVVTGVTVLSADRRETFACVTDVTFDTLSEAEMQHYVADYKPLDKAGAYGIQEYIGYIGVTGISGSYFNVMGLPVQKLYRVLLTF